MGLVWSAREGAAPGAPANARVSSGGERSEGSRRSETTQWAGARAGAGFRGGLAQMKRRGWGRGRAWASAALPWCSGGAGMGSRSEEGAEGLAVYPAGKTEAWV